MDGFREYDENIVLGSVIRPAREPSKATIEGDIQWLCSSCKAMLNSILGRETKYWVRSDYPAYFEFRSHTCQTISEYTQSGHLCKLCALISFLSRGHHGPVSLRHLRGAALSIKLFLPEGEMWVEKVISFTSTAEPSTTGDTMILQATDNLLFLTPVLRTFPGNPSTLSYLEQARSWLENCIKSHTLCRRFSSTSTPKRLIEIGSHEDQVASIRLCNGMVGGHAYLALSYCWGATLPLKTTQQTLEDYKSSIPWSEVPLTFRDAIQATLLLGFSYLWIDALCIVQDDCDEWTSQALHMDQIYAGAILTLSAMNARDASSGMFNGTESESEFVRIPVEIHSDGVFSSTNIYARLVDGDTLLEPDTLLLGPLNRRCWALQERILSPAVLHFCQGLLIWDCGEICQTDLGHNLKEPWYYPNVESAQIPYKLTLASQGPSLIQWFRLVEDYSIRNLTFESDKLPAFDGLAKWMQRYIGGNYVAGLWDNYLVQCLIWGTEDDAKRPSQDRAPSWSWASIEGSISYFPFFEETDVLSFQSAIRITKVEVRARSATGFGQVDGGALHLEGFISDAFTTQGLTSSKFLKKAHWYIRWDVFPEDGFYRLLWVGMTKEASNDTSGYIDEEYLILRDLNQESALFSRVGTAARVLRRGQDANMTTTPQSSRHEDVRFRWWDGNLPCSRRRIVLV